MHTQVWKWALSMLIGATMGTLAFMVDWGIDVLNNMKYKAVEAKIYGEGTTLGLHAAAVPRTLLPYLLQCHLTCNRDSHLANTCQRVARQC